MTALAYPLSMRVHDSYSGFLEDDQGRMIPGPYACHPALTSYAALIRGTSHVEFEVTIPNSTRRLHFRRTMLVAEDASGTMWLWPTWTDQFGRGVGGYPMASGMN